MTVSGVTPAWAIELVRLVCAEAGVEPPLALRWRRRSRPTSSGVTRRGPRTISLSAGTDELDQRLTLLHELAHWLGPMPIRRRRARVAHHDRAFYRTAFALYLRHGIDAVAAVRGEAARYPASLRHAVALDVPGSRALADDRRAMLAARRERRGPWRIAVPEHAVRLERDGRWTVCGVCGQRIVGPALARLRRRRRVARHTLWQRA